jgi:hypothetical protein
LQPPLLVLAHHWLEDWRARHPSAGDPPTTPEEA